MCGLCSLTVDSEDVVAICKNILTRFRAPPTFITADLTRLQLAVYRSERLQGLQLVHQQAEHQ